MESKNRNKNTNIYKTLLPLFKKEKTQNFTTLMLTIVTLSFFAIFAINPTITTIVHLQKQLTDSKFVEQKLQEKITNLTKLQAQYEVLKNDIPIVLDAIPQTPTVPLFTAQIQGVAEKNGASITQLQIFQVELTKNQAISKNNNAFAFSLSIEGTKNNLINFLSTLTNFQRIVTIQNITLGKTKTPTVLQLSIRGQAYFKP